MAAPQADGVRLCHRAVDRRPAGPADPRAVRRRLPPQLPARVAGEKSRYARRRFRALASFVASTGCRINEAVDLEWKDIDFARGVAWLYFK